MAKLSAHGHEVGRIEYLTRTRAYMSDGAVMQNDGAGWKLYARVKAGITPQAAFQNRKAAHEALLDKRPAFAAYRHALHDLAGLSKRWKLHAAVAVMPEDPDGVWSEACDGYGDNVAASVEEIVELCALARRSRAEWERLHVEAQRAGTEPEGA